jgi:hypothetical protein
MTTTTTTDGIEKKTIDHLYYGPPPGGVCVFVFLDNIVSRTLLTSHNICP